eukprot:10817361-Heterocapsa_arctica.AAC.1
MREHKDGETGLRTHGDIKKDIYKWIRGTKGNRPLIVSNGGSAQMKDILKLAEETWRFMGCGSGIFTE